jgi:hypothetical protein
MFCKWVLFLHPTILWKLISASVFPDLMCSLFPLNLWMNGKMFSSEREKKIKNLKGLSLVLCSYISFRSQFLAICLTRWQGIFLSKNGKEESTTVNRMCSGPFDGIQQEIPLRIDVTRVEIWTRYLSGTKHGSAAQSTVTFGDMTLIPRFRYRA